MCSIRAFCNVDADFLQITIMNIQIQSAALDDVPVAWETAGRELCHQTPEAVYVELVVRHVHEGIKKLQQCL